jgi:type IV pilus assembly protein PilQ
MRKIILIILIFTNFLLPTVYAGVDKNLTLDMQNVNLPDALRILAKFLNLNLVVSQSVRGHVSLHLHNASAQNVLDLLLASQGLSKWPLGNIWFISPSAEMEKRKQDNLQIQEAANDSDVLATRTWQIHYAKAEDIAKLLQDNNNSLLSKRGHVRVDARTNIICVQDVQGNLNEVAGLIKKFDIPVQQVSIKARLASVDSDFERELGINFSVHTGVLNAVGGQLSSADASRFSLAVATLADGSILDVALAAMENEGRGELISTPSLFTANQQTASIESGEEIPYQEVSLSGGTGIAFKKAVLRLKVTPQILPGGKVMLQLQVNQDRPSSRIVLGVPAITTRQISTNVLVKNGQTLVLGGIYEMNKELDEQRIPFLGKIPIVGLLFKQQNIKSNKRELLIFVTPTIISQT